MSEEKNTSVEEELIEAENDTASKKSISKAVVDLISIIATSIVAIMVVFTFLFRIVGVSGPSMMDTLRDGDWLIVSAFITEPERGDIVIVTQPNAYHEPIVKRVIAVEGDTIDIDFENAVVKINGEVINEPYLGSPTTNDEGAWQYPLTLKEGQVFVMGDNRMHSSDSRSPDIGLIDENYILGQVMMRFSPISEIKFFGDYDYE
ncbi:MAG: signal peptidase I [Clostridia bacterium]|nr:signal peptidase I [Clostridia bacterium]